MSLKTKAWDMAEHLETEADIAAYLSAVIEEDDPVLFRAALNDVARARGMAAIAREAGISRAALYKALGEEGNPSFATVTAIMKALGVRLSIAA